MRQLPVMKKNMHQAHATQDTIEPILLTPAEVSVILNISPQRLRRMRRTGRGPTFIDLGKSLVRYNTAEVHRWHTTDQAPSPGNGSPTSNL